MKVGNVAKAIQIEFEMRLSGKIKQTIIYQSNDMLKLIKLSH